MLLAIESCVLFFTARLLKRLFLWALEAKRVHISSPQKKQYSMIVKYLGSYLHQTTWGQCPDSYLVAV